MAQRIVVALIWFYVIWTVWNAAVIATGWSIFLGPVIAAAVSAVIAVDPFHWIWGLGLITSSGPTVIRRVPGNVATRTVIGGV